MHLFHKFKLQFDNRGNSRRLNQFFLSIESSSLIYHDTFYDLLVLP